MDYPVHCECGHTYQVAGTLAGTRWTCHCGRVVIIPSLSELKHQTGDLAAPPELIIQSMLKEGQLPEHDWCVICETDTDNVCWLKVICESISMQKKERLGCLSMMIMVLSPWELVLHLLGGGDEVQEVGRSVRFNLPIRLCDVCGKDQGKLTLKQVMSLVPIYAYLLGKYPHAEVSPSRG